MLGVFLGLLGGLGGGSGSSGVGGLLLFLCGARYSYELIKPTRAVLRGFFSMRKSTSAGEMTGAKTASTAASAIPGSPAFSRAARCAAPSASAAAKCSAVNLDGSHGCRPMVEKQFML